MTEANFLDPTPRTYRYEQVSYWGLDSNALAEPWEWDAAVNRHAIDDEKIMHDGIIGLQSVPVEG